MGLGVRRRLVAPRLGFRAWLVVLLACVLLLGAAACGDDDRGPGEGPDRATLVLDFIPGAVHAGIYVAEAAGYYEDSGIELRIVQPTSTADTLKLIDAGKADFGIADGIDLANQIQEGREAKGIMALLQRPAGGLITLAENDIVTPADLAGSTVGVTGVPSDEAVLEAIMADAGSSASAVEAVTIGFNGVPALEAGKIQAFTGFIPADGVQVESDGYPMRSFPLDENGGPSYPGLVFFSTASRIDDDPELMRGFVEATIKGYQDALEDPTAAVDALIARTQGIDRKLALRSFEAWTPFIGDPDTLGQFAEDDLESLFGFLVEADLAPETIEPERYATNEFTGGDQLTGGSGD